MRAKRLAIVPLLEWEPVGPERLARLAQQLPADDRLLAMADSV
jgi:hypothetical protein